MKRFFALAALTISAVVFAHAQQITRGSTVYIEPMSGYEMALTSAMTEKHVPLIMVADKDKARYVIKSTLRKTSNLIHYPHTSTNITVTDMRSSEILFAYTAEKGGDEVTAGAFAEQLKQFMEEKK